jgi:bacterioferritin-associated ferredoxin
VLLEHDHRVYYHWHIDDKQTQETVKQLLATASTLEEFVKMGWKNGGCGELMDELGRLLDVS